MIMCWKTKYRIVEVEHVNGEIDYTVQSSIFPGIWSTIEIFTGLYSYYLKGCDLEAAKSYVSQFEEEDEKRRGEKVKKSRVYKS